MQILPSSKAAESNQFVYPTVKLALLLEASYISDIYQVMQILPSGKAVESIQFTYPKVTFALLLEASYISDIFPHPSSHKLPSGHNLYSLH